MIFLIIICLLLMIYLWVYTSRTKDLYTHHTLPPSCFTISLCFCFSRPHSFSFFNVDTFISHQNDHVNPSPLYYWIVDIMLDLSFFVIYNNVFLAVKSIFVGSNSINNLLHLLQFSQLYILSTRKNLINEWSIYTKSLSFHFAFTSLKKILEI